MRGFALITATCLLVVALTPLVSPFARAQTTIPRLTIPVNGQELAGRPVFAPSSILVPQVPIELVVIFHNNETTPSMAHTFSVNDENETTRIDTDIVLPGGNATLNFTVLSMTRILFNGEEFTPETDASGIVFFCIPHRGVGMIGHIALATALQGEPAEKGILLRAYWIGIIGIAAMLVWIGISYFLIKSSSGHFTDHREHVRKGLP